MDLYDRMCNIKNNNIELQLQQSIADVRSKFSEIEEEKTCQFYTTALYRLLKEKNVMAHIINTSDLGYDYSHWFLLVPDFETCYLADLTFSQFSAYTLEFSDLLIAGYEKANNEFLDKYLSTVLNKKVDGSNIENLYLADLSGKRK